MRNPTVMYPRQFFEVHRPHQSEYEQIAAWLSVMYKPDSVVDFGCGNAFLLDYLQTHQPGVVVLGVDGSAAALEVAPAAIHPHLVQLDLREPVELGRQFDLVICTEVAEHLDEIYADILIETLTTHARPAAHIFFSAAVPGQVGEWHVNCQRPAYWLNKFWQRGWRVAAHDTCNFRFALAGQLPHIPWFFDNVIILEPCPCSVPTDSPK